MNLERNYKLKRVLLLSLCVLVLFGIAGCREKEITGKSTTDDEKECMKLYFNDIEIPIIWEDNQTVQELMKEAGKGDVVVQMSMYSGNEQVGSLGKSYTKNDESAFEKAYNGLQGWVDCFEKASLKGMVGGGGIDAANTAADHVDAMKKAYELGKKL